MKRLNGFTLIELLAVIVILGSLSTIAVVSYNNYIEDSKTDYYLYNLKQMETAAEEIIADCDVHSSMSFCTSVDRSSIDLKVLTDNGYLDEIKSQYGDKNVCEGSIAIDKTGSYLKYTATLKCDSDTITYNKDTDEVIFS